MSTGLQLAVWAAIAVAAVGTAILIVEPVPTHVSQRRCTILIGAGSTVAAMLLLLHQLGTLT